MAIAVRHMLSDEQWRRRETRPIRPERQLPLIWHIVQPGETLFSIAARYQCRPTQIAEMNHLSTRVLFPGTALRVPRDVTATDDGEADAGSEAAGPMTPVGDGVVSRHRCFSTPSPRPTSPLPDPAPPALHARASVKIIAENKGCAVGVLLVTPNRVRFEPHQSDPIVVDLGDEPFVASIPLRFIVSVRYYSEMADIYQHLYADDEPPRALHGEDGAPTPPESSGSSDEVLECAASSSDSAEASLPDGATGDTVDGAADSSSDGAAGGSPPASGTKRPCSSSFDADVTTKAAARHSVDLAAPEQEPAGRPRSAAAAPSSAAADGTDEPRAQSAPCSAAEKRRAFARRVSRNSLSSPPPMDAEENAPQLSSVIPIIASSTDSMDRSRRQSGDGRSDGSAAASLEIADSAAAPSREASPPVAGAASCASLLSGSSSSSQPGATSSASYDTAPEAAAAEEKQPSTPSGQRTPPHDGSGGRRKRMRFKSEVSIEEKPSLFVACDELLQEKAPASQQRLVYLVLLLGKRHGELVPTSEEVLYFGERRMPTQVVFAIPLDHCERLYKFLKECKPDICGPLDVDDLERRGYELIDPDAEHFEPEPVVKDATNLAEVVEETPEPVPPPLDVPYLPELVGASAVLTDEIQTNLQRLLPARVEGHPWSLVFSSSQHGISLKTLYRKAFEYDCPMLLFIQDSNQHVFGALSSDPIRYGPHFYGTGESFLFTCQPEFRAFRWSGENQFFVKGSPESLEFGSGDGHAGLFLDESLSHGITQRCNTFHNEPLTSSKEFDIISVELWALG